MNTFLPEGYQEVSNYMKFIDGDNRFRILSSAVVGNEYWNEDEEGNRKPIRKHIGEPLIISEIQEPDKIKKFWAFVVWNYQDKAIQILEVTQKGIRETIQGLIRNKSWGNPVNTYDLVVNKKGSGLTTKYTVQPNPKEPTDKAITEAYKNTPVNLEALFTGADPFLQVENDKVLSDEESEKLAEEANKNI